MPTFTFTYGKTREWDYKSSRSETGALTEYFRNNVSNVRTLHPIHSVCVNGPDQNIYKDFRSKSSFGSGSAWQKLCQDEDVWNVSLGIGLIGGATFCHVAEEQMLVPYREYLDLPGNVLDSHSVPVEFDFNFFARKTVDDKTASNYWNKLIRDLTSAKLLRSWNVGENIPMTLMHVKSTTEFISQKISEDPYYLGGYGKDIE